MSPLQPTPKPFMEELEPDIEEEEDTEEEDTEEEDTEEEDTEEEDSASFPLIFHPNCRCVIAFYPTPANLESDSMNATWKISDD